MLSERMLRKWRGEALRSRAMTEEQRAFNRLFDGDKFNETQDHILQLTQELLDQHLVRKS